MQKISESTAAATPAGEFTEGNPVGAVPATPIKAMWLNAIQRELVAVVEGAGLTLDKANDRQLLAAVQRLVNDANTWANITAKPSTLAGFGISDAFNKSETTTNIQTAIAAHFATTVTNALATKATQGAIARMLGYTDKTATNAAATGAVALNCSLADVFELTLTGATTLSVSNVPALSGETYSLVVRLTQGATAQTLTWFSGITWLTSGGAAPAAPGANMTAEFILSTKDGLSWIGRRGASQ